MADKKISELTELTTPDGTEELVVNDSGVSKKITQTNLLSTALPLAGGTMTGTIAGFTSTGIDDNATSTAITLDASERVGIRGAVGANIAMTVNGDSGSAEYAGIRFVDAAGGNQHQIFNGAGGLYFRDYTAGETRASINSTGNFSITTGNLVIGTSGKGIDFSATSDGSGTMTSEVLDDYEEGTWSATFTAAVTAPTTAQVETGLYTKVGNTVTARVYSNSFSMVGSSGILKVTGLPFSSSAATTHKAIGAITVHSLNLATGCSGLSSVVHAGATEIYFYEAKDGAAYGSITDNTATSARLWITITYQV